MPGMLPVLNKKAVEYAAKMALAVGCQVKGKSVFARKNYFYPDLPKGYQISQYEEPLAVNGQVTIVADEQKKQIGIIRIHMEDDAGKSIHSTTENVSYVDLNRTGVPLIEIVSAPDIRSSEEAVAYLKALRNILRYLDICDANLEEGNFRCDANVSLRPKGQKEFGTRTELKNMNSFRHVQKALDYEIARQKDLLEDGEEVVQETLLYDEAKNETRSMRGKEEAHDYRYFPDPDLVPLVVNEEMVGKWSEELPELPQARLERFIAQYALPVDDAQILTSERDLADYFEETVELFNEPKTVSNWVLSDLLRELREQQLISSNCPFRPEQLAMLLRLVHEQKISIKIGKDIFPDLCKKGLDPEQYIKDKGLVQISDQDALEQVVDEVIEENPQEVQAFKGGKKKLVSFFVGQVMKKTKGQANPKLVNQLLQNKLSD
jgi:aspartyl-tRNA(Asn)/glutamyl-tRNA(Gln) amidotransferase subunit B